MFAFDFKQWRHFDFWLMGAVILLTVFGVAMIRSATLTSIDPAVQIQAERQVQFIGIGLLVVLFMTFVDYRFWGGLSVVIYLTLILLLIYVRVVGVATFGAVRWIDLGIVNLQPSELGKFLVLITLSHYVANHATEVKDFTFVLRTLMHVGVPALLIFLQPDLSTAMLYGVVWFTVMWMAGMRMKHLGVLVGVVLVAIPFFVFFLFQTDELRYMANRVVLFVAPDTTSQAYRDAIYNINQALISVGSGGWLGEGYGQGSQVQSRFLKVRQTDFIFAGIAHEFGFVGAVLVIGLVAFIVIRAFRAGANARDLYGRLLCYGVGVVLMYEAFSNIASNMNMIPVSGSPLPFVSYGGTSLWTFLIGIGLVQSVSLRQKPIEF